MKHSLGKYFLFLLQLLYLHAGDFTHNITVDNTQPYVKEGILVNIELNQTNHDIVLLFDFDLVKSKEYTFRRVGIEQADAYHAAYVRYSYLVYPLKEGKVPIRFKLIQKATTDESVAYSFSGDRDNVKGLVTTDTNITLDPVIVNVKPLPSGTELVGDFSLKYLVKKHKALAFEPLALQIIIQGKGYPPLLKDILPQEGNFTRFSHEPDVKTSANLHGTQNSVTYAMALSSDKSFTLPERSIKAFNPKKKRAYTLSIPQQHFEIQEGNASLLVDAINNPPLFKIDWSWLTSFLSYLLVFLSGYFTAFALKRSSKSKVQNNPLKEKIQQAKSHKELLQILLSQETKHFTSSIEQLERTLYKKDPVPLKQIKQASVKQIPHKEG